MNKKYGENDGVWRTVAGRRVFIRNGQSLEDAMNSSGKFEDIKRKIKEKKKDKKARLDNEDKYQKSIEKGKELEKKYRKREREDLRKRSNEEIEEALQDQSIDYDDRRIAEEVLNDRKKLGNAIKNSSTNTKDGNKNYDKKGNPDSLTEYTDKNGKLKPEREKVHQEILNEYFEGKLPVDEDERVFYMTGGGSGTGKSNFLKDSKKYYGREFNYNEETGMFEGNIIKVDPDDLKKAIHKRVGSGELDAGYYHEESSALAKRITSVGMDNGYLVLSDGVNGGSNKIASKIEQAHQKGYKVYASYGTIPYEKALENNWNRYEKGYKKDKNTARIVTAKEVVKAHYNVSEGIMGSGHLFDKLDIYDMSDYDNVKKIGTVEDGKLKPLRGYESLFDNFEGKAKLSEKRRDELMDYWEKVYEVRKEKLRGEN
jgi:hypothetical protein